jgi:hypothetical protein
VRRSRSVVLSILVTCALVPAAARQAVPDRPNFSGIWHLLEDRSMTHQQGEPVLVTVWPSPLRVRQGRERLIIAVDADEGMARSYRLDGHPSVNKVPGPNGPIESVAVATWAGSRLVITERLKVESDAGESVRRLTLNVDGTLSVEAPWGDEGAFVASVYARTR